MKRGRANSPAWVATAAVLAGVFAALFWTYRYLGDSLSFSGFQTWAERGVKDPLELPIDEATVVSVDHDGPVSELLREVAQLYGLKTEIPPELGEVNSQLKLSHVSWEAVFDLCLQPAGYTFFQRRHQDGAVVVLRTEKLAQLPPESFEVRLIYLDPAEAAAFFHDPENGYAQDADRIISLPAQPAVRVTTRPERVGLWIQLLERADRPQGFHRWPDEIHWPNSIPKGASHPKTPAAIAPGMPTPPVSFAHSQVVVVDEVDARKVARRLEETLATAAKGLHIQPDPLENTLFVTGKRDVVARVVWITRYLDHKEWYLPPDERPPGWEPPEPPTEAPKAPPAERDLDW